MSVAGTVAVTGATGFVGRHAVRELLARGWRVRALTRDLVKGSEVLPGDERVEPVRGDMFDHRALGELLDGCAAAVNAVGILREAGGGQSFQRVHVEGVRKLLGAMAQKGVDRLVQVSALGVGAGAKTAYARTKFDAEQLIRTSGVRWTILRPSLVHGAEGEFMRQAADWARGRSAPYLFMPYFARTTGSFPAMKLEAPRIQPVAVEDLARAIGQSLERDASVGEIYPIAGGEVVTWPQMLEFVRDHVSLARPGIRVRGIPAKLAAVQARAASLLGMGALLPFDEGMAEMGARDSTATSGKARAHLDLEPAGFREAAAGYLGTM